MKLNEVEENIFETRNNKLLNQWQNQTPVDYAKKLMKYFGEPEELTKYRAIWHQNDGFKRIEIIDEYVLHPSPSPHYDFVYSYVDLKVPQKYARGIAESSESILVDYLKGEVGARCGSLSANAVTINYVMDVVSKGLTPSKKEYEKRINSLGNKLSKGENFELDWWPDVTNDAKKGN